MKTPEWLYREIRVPTSRYEFARNPLLFLLMGLGVFLMLGGPWLVSATPLGEIYRNLIEGSSFNGTAALLVDPTESFLFLLAGIAGTGFIAFFTGFHWFLQQKPVERNTIIIMLGSILLLGVMVSIYGVHLYNLGRESMGIQLKTLQARNDRHNFTKSGNS